MTRTSQGFAWRALMLLTFGVLAGCAGGTKMPETGSPAPESAPEPPPTIPELPAPQALPNRSSPDKILHYAPDLLPEPEKPDPEYTVVKVFYGTDRSVEGADQWQQSKRPGYPRLAGLLLGAGLVLLVVTRRRGRWSIPRCAAWAVLAASVVCGAITVYGRLQPDLAKRNVARMYGAGRGALELGVCEVSVPKSHDVGELESPSVLRLELREDPQRHVVLLGVRPEPAETFYAGLRDCVGRSRKKEAFVFVHGYNVSFEDAARRTAQIAYDLAFDGAPIFYSWPSQATLVGYPVDETNAAWTVPDLKEFLLGVARRSGARSIHLIAHSMGNRALTSALRELSSDLREDCPRFHQVVLTAPDIDAEVFRRDLAPAIVKAANRVTLYASSTDEALVLSKQFHGYPRAGDAGPQIIVVPNIDTIDVSGIDTSLLGHSYYGSNSTVLADLFDLVHLSKPPGQRKWLRAIQLEALTYWRFLREQVEETAPPPEL